MNTTTLLLIALIVSSVSATLPSCNSLIYCQGNLLDTVQRAKIFADSKTFVDMIQINPSNTTLRNFEKFMKEANNNPTGGQIRQFVKENFQSSGELIDWRPPDYKSSPKFLDEIEDLVIKDFARSMVTIWPDLGRKVENTVFENQDRHSLIPVPNGFIIPGGRFKEIYYWDSYWIIKGLLLSEMYNTVKGMLENFISIIEKYGFIPNGSRVYYLNRSQPPLLAMMIGIYIDHTSDIGWLKNNIGYIEAELKWWLNNRTIAVEKDGVKYELAHYSVKSGTPRPESYSEDVTTCGFYKETEEIERCYRNLKSGAESGWDFSSRWIFDPTGSYQLYNVDPIRVIPVDLNAFLCRAFHELARFYKLLKNPLKEAVWLERAASWQKSIELVLYDRADGIWYDYDLTEKKLLKKFYPSNFAPLWTQSYDTSLKLEYGARAAKYFTKQGILNFDGGIPTSLVETGEQWDLPNAWPPLQEIVILGLKFTGNAEAEKIANTFAKRWINANIRGYAQSKEMYEKYDAVNSGQYGGGGEYTIQKGFGWTNGVVLSIIDKFYATGNNRARRCL